MEGGEELGPRVQGDFIWCYTFQFKVQMFLKIVCVTQQEDFK